MNDLDLNTQQGWIMVYRSLMDSDIWHDPEGLKIWLWILLKAHHDEEPRKCALKINKGRTIVRIFKGQFIFGRKVASQELGMPESTIYRWIKKLSKKPYCMISELPNNNFTIISVNNYDSYQVKKRTTHELPMNTDNNNNNKDKNLRPESLTENPKKRKEIILSNSETNFNLEQLNIQINDDYNNYKPM